MSDAYYAERLAYAYPNANGVALSDLHIAAGKITALIGPNGSGKSTLLELLAFLKTPQQGRLIFYDTATTAAQQTELRRHIGWVAQNPYFIQGNVLSNVELGLRLRGLAAAVRQRQAMAALAQVEMADAALRPIAQLSGGERQKIALARALATQPQVLLWDEPFTYLDRNSVHLVEQLLSGFVSLGGTAVFSTHERLRGMALADQVVSLVSGRIVAAPLVNLLHGQLHNGDFVTGKLVIHVPHDLSTGRHLAIDPVDLVLSPQPLQQSSLRNGFSGRVVSVAEQGDKVAVCVDVGELLHALITWEAYQELALKLGQHVWVSFKATAVSVF